MPWLAYPNKIFDHFCFHSKLISLHLIQSNVTNSEHVLLTSLTLLPFVITSSQTHRCPAEYPPSFPTLRRTVLATGVGKINRKSLYKSSIKHTLSPLISLSNEHLLLFFMIHTCSLQIASCTFYENSELKNTLLDRLWTWWASFLHVKFLNHSVLL